MNSRGFTLVEWLIAMVIGVFLLGGVLAVFVASRSTTNESFDQSELLENGRIAMRLITQDLRWAGFWGDFTGGALTVGDELTLSSGATVANDCLDERNEGSLPSSLFPVRPLWVAHISTAGTMSGFACISSPTRVANTDVISIKRLIGNPVTGGLDANRFYMATNTQMAHLFRGNETAPSETTMPMRQIWEYQHHVYYLSPNGSGGFELRKRMLTADGGSWLISGALVDGIERMVLLFGVDTSNVPDGRIDKFSAIDAVTSQEWGEGRVIAVRVFLLVRSLQASSRYTNNNVYQLGDVSVAGNGDGFRRLLLESTVVLRNPMMMAGGGQ